MLLPMYLHIRPTFYRMGWNRIWTPVEFHPQWSQNEHPVDGVACVCWWFQHSGKFFSSWPLMKNTGDGNILSFIPLIYFYFIFWDTFSIPWTVSFHISTICYLLFLLLIYKQLWLSMHDSKNLEEKKKKKNWIQQSHRNWIFMEKRRPKFSKFCEEKKN